MIELQNIYKSYDYPVLKDMSITFNKEITGIMGHSGSGKTTLLKLIAGIEKSDDGVIKIENKIVTSNSNFVSPNLRNISFGFQSNALWPHLKVWQQIALASGGLDSKHKRIALDLTEELGLKDLANSAPSKISGGQAKRVSLARAFAAEKSVILLDEPLVHLDLEAQEFLTEWIIKRVAKHNITLLVSSHDEKALDKLCHKKYTLSEGRLHKSEAI